MHWWITDLIAQGAQGASTLDKKLGAELSLAPEFSVFSISHWIEINCHNKLRATRMRIAINPVSGRFFSSFPLCDTPSSTDLSEGLPSDNY